MAKLDNIIRLGEVLDGGALNPNEMLNRLPQALASITLKNAEDAKEQERYNDQMEMQQNELSRRNKNEDITFDIEMGKSLVDPNNSEASLASLQNWTPRTDEGIQMKMAQIRQFENKGAQLSSYNTRLKDLKKSYGTISNDEWKLQYDELVTEKNMNPIFGTKFDSSLESTLKTYNQGEKKEVIGDFISMYAPTGENQGQLIDMLSSEQAPVSLVKGVFESMVKNMSKKEMTSADLQSLIKFGETLQGDPANGIPASKYYPTYVTSTATIFNKQYGTNISNSEYQNADISDYEDTGRKQNGKIIYRSKSTGEEGTLN